MHAHRNHTQAFTLVELLIVVVIMITLSRIVFAAFSDINNKQILINETAQVKSYIQKARMNALNAKDNDSHGLVFSTSTVSVIEVLATSTLFVYVLNDRIKLTASTLGTSTLIFSRVTGLPNATGTLTYSYNISGSVTATSTLTIDGAGIVQ